MTTTRPTKLKSKRQPKPTFHNEAVLSAHSSASLGRTSPWVWDPARRDDVLFHDGRIYSSSPRCPDRTSPASISTARRYQPSPQNPQDTFCTLPLDIHELIFSYLDDLVDLTCVGLMSPYLWGVTQDIIHRRYRSRFGCFAGENIVFAGSEIVPGDYPSALFSAEEVEDLNGCFFFKSNDSDDDHHSGKEERESFTLYNLSDRRGTRYYETTSIKKESRLVYSECQRRTTIGPERVIYSPSSWFSAVYRKSNEIKV